MDSRGSVKSKWRWLFLALALLPVVELALTGGALAWAHAQAALAPGRGEIAGLGVIGGADGPTAILVAVSQSAFAWGLWEKLCLALAALAVFLLLSWPQASGIVIMHEKDGPTAVFVKVELRSVRLWLPAALAGAACLVWLVRLGLALAGQMEAPAGVLTLVLYRFALQGGALAAAALFFAARRILRAWRSRG